MRITRALALVTLALSAAAQPSPAEPRLKSLTDRSDLLGWEAVGRLDIEGQGYCSAVLIAPDILMTAAHCLLDPETEEKRPVESILFRAGFRDGEAIATRHIRAAIVPDTYVEADDEDLGKLRNDVALLRLANPIPASTAAPYRIAGLPGGGGSVTVVSYGHGRSNAASRQSGCHVLHQGQGLALFDCDGVPGSSGAPVFSVNGQHPRIVSLISSGSEYEGQEVVVGMDLPGLVPDLLRDLRAGVGVWPTRLPDARRVATGERAAGGARFLRP